MKLRWILLMLFVTLGVSACGGGSSDEKELTLAPESALPEFVRGAPAQVREAYRFAIANPDIVSQFPCFCGCGAVGHMSNLDCYIQEFQADGSIIFDDHAYGWTHCVDVTRDVMRLLRQGQELKDIRAYIDAEYIQYGPPTDTEPIP